MCEGGGGDGTTITGGAKTGGVCGTTGASKARNCAFTAVELSKNNAVTVNRKARMLRLQSYSCNFRLCSKVTQPEHCIKNFQWTSPTDRPASPRRPRCLRSIP